MFEDRYGNPISVPSGEARDAYVKAVDLFLAAAPGVTEALQHLTQLAPEFAPGHIALARQMQSLGRGADVPAHVDRALSCLDGATARERGHVELLAKVVTGQGGAAWAGILSHLAEYPRDAMIAQTGVGVFGLIGFSGRSGREAEQLAFTAMLAPHYGDDWWFLAQHAFALGEAGMVDAADRVIEQSLVGNARNANAAHIRAHVHYEAGATGEGLAFLNNWLPDYDRTGLMHCHLNWHVALWALAEGDADTMWRVIDGHVAPGAAWGPPLNVLTDMAAILWRAELAGVDVPAHRWQAISDYAGRRFPEPGIAFADIHSALSHAMAGRGDLLDHLITDAKGPVADLVRPLATAFRDMAANDWASALANVTGVMAQHERFGGSRAQRDLVEYAMALCLIKTGRAEEAGRLLLTRRPVTTSIKDLQAA